MGSCRPSVWLLAFLSPANPSAGPSPEPNPESSRETKPIISELLVRWEKTDPGLRAPPRQCLGPVRSSWSNAWRPKVGVCQKTCQSPFKRALNFSEARPGGTDGKGGWLICLGCGLNYYRSLKNHRHPPVRFSEYPHRLRNLQSSIHLIRSHKTRQRLDPTAWRSGLHEPTPRG